MSIVLRKQPTVIKEYDEKLVRRLIDKVTVYEDRFEVVFRSGVMVEVEEKLVRIGLPLLSEHLLL